MYESHMNCIADDLRGMEFCKKLKTAFLHLFVYNMILTFVNLSNIIMLPRLLAPQSILITKCWSMKHLHLQDSISCKVHENFVPQNYKLRIAMIRMWKCTGLKTFNYKKSLMLKYCRMQRMISSRLLCGSQGACLDCMLPGVQVNTGLGFFSVFKSFMW